VEVYALQCSAYKQVVRHSMGTVQPSNGNAKNDRQVSYSS